MQAFMPESPKKKKDTEKKKVNQKKCGTDTLKELKTIIKIFKPPTT